MAQIAFFPCIIQIFNLTDCNLAQKHVVGPTYWLVQSHDIIIKMKFFFYGRYASGPGSKSATAAKKENGDGDPVYQGLCKTHADN